MEHNQTIPLNIVIGDRNYRIKILPPDEEIIRKTLKTLNEKILEFRNLYAGKDMQDYIAMVLIWYATQLNENKEEIFSTEIVEALTKMERQLDSALI